MKHDAVFRSSHSQAVLLPKSAVLTDDVKLVHVVAIGRMRMLSPAGDLWGSWFDGDGVSPDFAPTRDQHRGRERDGF